MEMNRREFVKQATVTAGAIAFWTPIACSPTDTHTSLVDFSISTKMSIDDFVSRFCPNKDADIDNGCNAFLNEHKEIISASGEYKCPPNLLAVMLSIEQERGIERDICDFIGKFWKSDYSVGVAQIMIGRGLGLLSGVADAKGYSHVRNHLSNLNKAEKFELGEYIKTYILDKGARTRLRQDKEVLRLVEKSLVNSPSLSIEAASYYMGLLSQKLIKAHNITSEDFRSNPIAAYMVLNAYRGGENELNRHRQAKHISDLDQFILEKLAYLRSGSRIDRMFRSSYYSMVPEKRYKN